MPLNRTAAGTIGLIAGQGELVSLTAAHLRDQGHTVVAVTFNREAAASVAELCDEVQVLKLGQLNKLINFFQARDAEQIYMIGKIHKVNMFRDVRPDTRALRIWKSIVDRRDDTILIALVEELEREGLPVGRIDRCLSHLLAPRDKISRRAPDRRERADAAFGWKLAKGIGKLDLGQTVVVKDRAPVAVEAIEGTDQTILRAGELAGRGTVVVKVAKPRQDFRFDVPTVGPETIRSLVSAGSSALAVEAGKTLIVRKDELLPLVRKHRIAFWGCRTADFRSG